MSEVDNDETNRLKVGIGVFAAVTATAVFALVLFFFVRKLVQLFYIIKIICRIELFCRRRFPRYRHRKILILGRKRALSSGNAPSFRGQKSVTIFCRTMKANYYSLTCDLDEKIKSWKVQPGESANLILTSKTL